MTVSALSLERYVDVCHPSLAFKCKSSSKSRAIKAIFVIWLVGFFCTLLTSLHVGLAHDINNQTVAACAYHDGIGKSLSIHMGIFYNFVPVILISVTYTLTILKLKKLAEKSRSSNESNDSLEQRAQRVLSRSNILITFCL